MTVRQGVLIGLVNEVNWIVAVAAAVLALNSPDKQAMSVRHWAAQ